MTLPFDPNRKESRDEDLRRAFTSLDENDAALALASDEFDADTVYRAAAGELPAAERLRLIDRMASDPALAEAWRLAVELQAAARRADPSIVPAPVHSLGRKSVRWNPAGLAFAAILMLAIGIGVRNQLQPEPTWRGQRVTHAIELLGAEKASLPRRAATLRWRLAEGSSTASIRVVVTTAEAGPVFIGEPASPSAINEFTVPETALAKFPAGARLLWRVEGRALDGTPISSPVGVFVLAD